MKQTWNNVEWLICWTAMLSLQAYPYSWYTADLFVFVLQELTKTFCLPSRSVSVNWSTSANSGNTGWWHHFAMQFSTWSQCCWQDTGVDETWAGSQICVCVACWSGPCTFKKSILQRKDVTVHWWTEAWKHFTETVQCETFRRGKIQMLHSRFKYRVFRWARCR